MKVREIEEQIKAARVSKSIIDNQVVILKNELRKLEQDAKVYDTLLRNLETELQEAKEQKILSEEKGLIG